MTIAGHHMKLTPELKFMGKLYKIAYKFEAFFLEGSELKTWSLVNTHGRSLSTSQNIAFKMHHIWINYKRMLLFWKRKSQ